MRFKVEGVSVLSGDLKRMAQLSQAEADAAVRRTALDIHRAEIKYLNLKTKRRTGALARILVAFPEKALAVIEPTAPHAPFIEFGTKPHTIRARNKKVLASRQGGFTKGGVKYGIYNIYGTEVQHPGTSARPFVEPAAAFGERQLEKHMEAALDKALSSK